MVIPFFKPAAGTASTSWSCVSVVCMSDRILPKQLQEQRTEVIARTVVIGGLVNLGLAATKVGAGVLWQSQALVADGIHSLSDLLSDVLVWYVGRRVAQAPDLEHPYGHGRYRLGRQ